MWATWHSTYFPLHSFCKWKLNILNISLLFWCSLKNHCSSKTMLFPSRGSSLVKKWVMKYIFSVFTGYRNKSKVSENDWEVLWEHEHRQVFSQLFRVLQNVSQCFCNQIETGRKYLLLPLENIARKKNSFLFRAIVTLWQVETAFSMLR